MTSIYDMEAQLINGDTVKLDDYQGKVMLIVNTASKCGLTPQFKGLEELYQEYHERGLEIIGFPCNQFASQDPGSNEAIQEFCEMNYGVTFPMYAKVEVNGGNTHPLFKHLKKQAPGFMGSQNIKWNFTKFLVGKDGEVLKRFAPTITPAQIRSDIEKALAA